MAMKKRQHKGSIAAARQRFLRDKLEKGKITREEYAIASGKKTRGEQQR